MITILAMAGFMWLMGWRKTLFVYIGLLATLAAFFFMMVSGVGISYLFDGNEMRTWQFTNFWADDYLRWIAHDPGFLIEALAMPFIFALDCIRIWIWLLVDHTQIPLLVTSAIFIYATYNIWYVVYAAGFRKEKKRVLPSWADEYERDEHGNPILPF